MRLYPQIREMPPAISLAPAYATISAIGIALVVVTARRLGAEPARIAAAALACAIGASICRSIDLMMCSVIPFGTHFLWHILLSLAAYLAILMLTKLRIGERREQAT